MAICMCIWMQKYSYDCKAHKCCGFFCVVFVCLFVFGVFVCFGFVFLFACLLVWFLIKISRSAVSTKCLKETSGCHLVHLLKQGHWSRLPSTKYRCLLNIPKKRSSTTSLGILCHCSVTLTAN